MLLKQKLTHFQAKMVLRPVVCKRGLWAYLWSIHSYCGHMLRGGPAGFFKHSSAKLKLLLLGTTVTAVTTRRQLRTGPHCAKCCTWHSKGHPLPQRGYSLKGQTREKVICPRSRSSRVAGPGLPNTSAAPYVIHHAASLLYFSLSSKLPNRRKKLLISLLEVYFPKHHTPLFWGLFIWPCAFENHI